MKTSIIKIRPFIPFNKNEKEENREPYAVLKYGNVEIELDYTLMRMLKIDCKSHAMIKSTSIANAGFKEILNEMDYNLEYNLPNTHRDSGHPTLELISHNPLHSINSEHVSYEK